MSASKLMTKASSLGRSVFSRNEAANFLFHFEHAQLAIAGIDENAEGQRQIGFGLEIFDGLGLAVLGDVKVVFGEVGDQRAMLVFDVEEELDDLDVDLEGFDGLVLRLVAGGSCRAEADGGAGVCATAAATTKKISTNTKVSDRPRPGTVCECSLDICSFYPETLLVYPVRAVKVRCTKEARLGI